METSPSLPLDDFVGVYTDKMFGDIQIQMQNADELEISFSNSFIFKGKLTHWHFDTFQIEWDDIRVPKGYVTFNFNSNREITGITFDQQNLLDVDFRELDIKKK